MYYTPGLNNYRLKHEEDLSGEKFDEGGACSENMRSDRNAVFFEIGYKKCFGREFIMKESSTPKVLNWLLEKENPSIRYFTLTYLLGRDQDDPEVKEARQFIMTEGVVPKIMARQNADGSWGDPMRFYRDKYQGTSWTLLILAELGADPDDSGIRRACEFILNRSQEPMHGGFSYDTSSKTGTGLPGGVIPCLTGNMVFSLVKLGYQKDPRVTQAIEWITTYQRADDGILQPQKGELYDRRKMCFGAHSCHMGVAKTLKGLTAVPKDERTIEINETIEKLTEYFLIHHLYKKSHDLQEVAKPGWLKLGFPLMYQTDILELLVIFRELGIRDPRLQDAADILKKKRLDNGTWKLENTFNGRTVVSIEKKGAPSKWITLKALIALKEDEGEG